jgi:DNA primase
VQGPERRQLELLLAIVVNHPTLMYRHAEELAAMPILAGELDRLRRTLVDLAAGHPDLDSEEVKDHLSQKGFSGMLSALLGGTRTIGFVDSKASLEQAEEGLAHVLGLMREKEAKRESEAAAQLLAEELTEEALARFEARQRVVQHGESRRRDLDRDGPLAARTKR